MNRPLPFLLAAIFLAASTAAAQSTPPTTAPANPQAPAQPSAPPEKKVWTNDDLSAPGQGGVSQPAAAKTPRPAKNSRKDAQWYRNQIAKLEGQIPPLDKQMDQLERAIAGDASAEDAARKYNWAKPGDWKAQLAQVQKKRSDILQKISALEDDARHQGFQPGDLR